MTTIPLFRLRSAFAVKTVATMPTPFLRWNSHHYYYLFNPIKSHWYLNTDHPFFVISKQVSETYYQWGEFCRTWKSSQIPTTTVAAGSLTFTFFTFTDSLSQFHFNRFTFTDSLSQIHFHRFTFTFSLSLSYFHLFTFTDSNNNSCSWIFCESRCQRTPHSYSLTQPPNLNNHFHLLVKSFTFTRGKDSLFCKYVLLNFFCCTYFLLL